MGVFEVIRTVALLCSENTIYLKSSTVCVSPIFFPDYHESIILEPWKGRYDRDASFLVWICIIFLSSSCFLPQIGRRG